MTYVENELLPLGFHLVSKEERRPGFVHRVVLLISHLKLQFDCGCPAYPNIIALGCPIHHPGHPGSSWPVDLAKKLPAALSM